MTIPTANIRMDYPGNGSTVTFPYTYKAFANTDLRVLLTEDATGVSVTQTLTTHYTVSGVGSESGGNVVMVTAPPVGYTLTILATIANTQTTDLVNETRFFQSRIEDRMDKLCRADQVQAEKQSRSMVLPESEAGNPTLTTLPPLAERKGKTQAYDAITGAPVMFSTASTAVSASMEPVVQASTLALARLAMDPNKGDWLVRATGSTTDRSAKNRCDDIINGLDWGADKTGFADSTAAINAALAAAGGRPVFLPSGTYKITGSINIPTYGTLFGAGGGTVLQGAYNGPIIKGSTSGTARMYKQTIRDLVIDGTNKATYPLSCGVRLLDMSQAYVENVLVRNCGDGFDIYATGGFGAYYNTLIHCDAATCDIGFYNGSGANENQFFGCRAVDVGTGFQHTDISGNHMVSCAIETFTGYGVLVNGSSLDLRIIGVRLENNPTVGVGISINSTSYRTMIIAPYYLGLTTNINNGSAETFIFGYDGLTIKSGTPILKHLSTMVTVDVGNIPAGTCVDTLIAFTGVAATDTLVITPDLNIDAGLMVMAIPYSGGNNFYLRMANVSAGAINPPSLTHRVDAWKH